MNELVDTIIECDFEHLGFNEFPINEKFGIIVWKSNIKYEFLLNLKENSQNLICIGSGALNPPDLETFRQKPRFNRHSWKFSESTLFYNDPTRYLNDSILGGWCIGEPDNWYLEEIKEIIVKITEYLNIKNENILFYGSSLGGFNSIQLGTLVRNSKVLADVPQLTLENANYVRYIMPILFPDLTNEEIKYRFDYRLNILDLIKREKYIPNAIMIFDAGEVDIKEHYTHFFSQLNGLTDAENSNRIKIIINPLNEHHFMSMEETLTVIQQACDNDLMCFGDEIHLSKLYSTLKEHEMTIEAKNQEIQNLKDTHQNEIDAKNQEIENLKNQKNAEIANLKAKNSELEQKFNEISNSTIWRLTKPLRKLLNLLKNK
ncbi:hypothetical protein [Methanobrevibacter sp.]|uniref:hypothetical protein n=1 Tax=Methanobrevibacter sp. TaxID=66852 RepID=UPI002E7A3CA0|nr:hypothetical protein [Methanobrevibacter sp.]MEE0938322.1 hypothetical protein [Methanobrevibacter sp.]